MTDIFSGRRDLKGTLVPFISWCTIVVARYQEDLTWTSTLASHMPDTRILVYNKGPDDLLVESAPLPNVGREGHTYFTYICTHYDTLSDYTVFLQGDPLDHSPRLLDELPLLMRAVQDGEVELDFGHLSDQVHQTTFAKEHEYFKEHCHRIYDTYRIIFGHDADADQSILYGAGAQFIVSKAHILRRPRAFYERIVQLLDHDVDPPEGYDVERFHTMVFDPRGAVAPPPSLT